MLAEGAYPLEVSISFSAALFHWLDSLTGLQDRGMSAGKTVEAHRRAFDRLFGRPDTDERRLLWRFGEIRREYVKRHLGSDQAETEPEGGASALLVAFLDEPDLESALGRARPLLSEQEHRELVAILEYFAPRYEEVWSRGEIPRRFVQRARGDRRLKDLVALLARMATFFGVDPRQGPPPHLVLAPVEDGYGTHAQANGRHLLIEIRSVDDVATTASVIAHENAHLLMGRIGDARLERLERLVQDSRAAEAARGLREALPTALGQGVADRKFRREWTSRVPWYHTREVDRYAKRIYPLVEEALAGAGTFDEALLRRLLAIYPGSGAIPRSP
jgi:hypothetical protein